MNPIEKLATERLAAAGRAKDRSRRLAWASLFAALFLLILLAVALADYWLVLPPWARFGGMLALAALTAAGLVRAVRLFRQPTNLKEAALDAEAQYPALGCVVSTAAEYLAGQRKITQEYEPQLVAALEEQAARAMSRARVPYLKKLRVPLLLLGAGLLVLAGFFLFSNRADTALKRIASPWTPETYTEVRVQPGDLEVPLGRDVEIKCEFIGRAPKAPQFNWRQLGETNWHKHALATNESGQYGFVVSAVRQPFLYRITGGDAVSPDYHVVPYIPPEVQDLKVQLALPAYTGRAPRQQATPDISVLRASTATFQVRPNVPLQAARLVFDQLPAVDLVKSGDDLWTGAITVATNAKYWIELTDLRRHIGTNATAYPIRALPDEPPKVEITEPGKDLRAELTDTVPISISVTDDYGVSQIRLKYHKMGQPEKTVVVAGQKTAKGEIRATTSLRLPDLQPQPYEVLSYYAEADDNNTLDGPGIGRSKVFFIEFTSPKSSAPKPPSQSAQSPPPPKVNLLTVQKQVIADTRELSKKSSPEDFKELAEREKTAAEFAEAYRDAMSAMGAPPEAIKNMDTAANAMKQAAAALEQGQQQPALPPEEKALAEMYQALKHVPELQNLPMQAQPGQPPAVQIALEGIKKKQEQQAEANQQELSELANQIGQLSQSQAALNEALQAMLPQERQDQGQPSEPNGNQPGASEQPGTEPGQAQNPGQQPQGQTGEQGQLGQGQGKGQKGKAEAKGGQGKAGQKGQGKGQKGGGGEKPPESPGGQQNPEQAQNPDGQGEPSEQPGNQPGQKGGKGKGKGQKGNQPGQPGQPGGDPSDEPSPEQLAQQQEQLGQQGDELAQKLAKLAGKDGRLGHNIPKAMDQAVAQLKAAGKSLKGGKPGQGYGQAREGGYGLNTVFSKLEKLIAEDKELTDTSSEDFPKEYETAIRDFLKRLSHQE